MNRIFGSTRKTPKPTISDAITSTDGRIDAITVKIKKLDAELVRYKEQLKKPGNQTAVKQRAMRILKQKKMYEAQVDQLQQQSFNMEQAAMGIDNLKNTMTTVEAMKDANKVLKQQYKNINVDSILSIGDEMEDLLEEAAYVQESLGRSYNIGEDIGDDELEAELDLLAVDLLSEDEEPTYLEAPSVPEHLEKSNLLLNEAPVVEEKPVGV